MRGNDDDTGHDRRNAHRAYQLDWLAQQKFPCEDDGNELRCGVDWAT
jgi:hypothetical protein